MIAIFCFPARAGWPSFWNITVQEAGGESSSTKNLEGRHG
jgi:hypothetical protein